MLQYDGTVQDRTTSRLMGPTGSHGLKSCTAFADGATVLICVGCTVVKPEPRATLTFATFVRGS